MKTLNVSGDVRGLSGLVRPRYSPGLLLEDEDLTAGVDYTRELNRLLFRSLFGCGVICGLKVRANLVCEGRKLSVTVDPGVALDAMGDAIALNREATLLYDPECAPFPPQIWVEICRTETGCRPRDVSCACDGPEPATEKTRLREGYEIKLHAKQPGCSCSTLPPAAPETTSHGRCCGETANGPAADAAPPESHDPYADHRNGVCSCGCGCSCVLLGVVQTAFDPSKSEQPVDRSAVRRIRPVLVGDPVLAGMLAPVPKAVAGTGTVPPSPPPGGADDPLDAPVDPE